MRSPAVARSVQAPCQQQTPNVLLRGGLGLALAGMNNATGVQGVAQPAIIAHTLLDNNHHLPEPPANPSPPRTRPYTRAAPAMSTETAQQTLQDNQLLGYVTLPPHLFLLVPSTS